MVDMSMELRPRRRAGADVRRFHQGAVVSTSGVGATVALNPTALALWELCDGTTTVAEMVTAVCDLFAIDAEQARADVTAALADMRSVGVIS